LASIESHPFGFIAVAALDVITAFAVPNLNTILFGESLICPGSVACQVTLASWSLSLLRHCNLTSKSFSTVDSLYFIPAHSTSDVTAVTADCDGNRHRSCIQTKMSGHYRYIGRKNRLTERLAPTG
jgi:hypothetical protein